MITGQLLNYIMLNQTELKKYQQIYFGRKSFTVFMLKFIDTKNITHATSEPIIDAWYGSTNAAEAIHNEWISLQKRISPPKWKTQ